MEYTAIIARVMSDKCIAKKFIRERSRRQGVRGFSQIKCSNPKCDWSWNTHQAHAVIDLLKQKVVRIYKQKCKKCDHESSPSFGDSVFQTMVGKALEQEKKFRNKNSGNSSSKRRFFDDDDESGGPPHESSLCEKCGYGSSPCWMKNRRR